MLASLCCVGLCVSIHHARSSRGKGRLPIPRSPMLDSVVIQGTFCNIFLLSMSCAGASLTRHSASMPVRRVCELRGWIMCACVQFPVYAWHVGRGAGRAGKMSACAQANANTQTRHGKELFSVPCSNTISKHGKNSTHSRQENLHPSSFVARYD